MKKNILALIIFLVIASCNREEKILYQTWNSRGDTFPEIQIKAQETKLVSGDYPMAGTVSHHLLAGEYIDNWFVQLKSKRDVKNFIILSPGHWGLETWDWSLTDGSWETSYGRVDSNKKMLKHVRSSLGVGLNQNAFYIEHGVEALIPFVAKYFPKAKVLTIAYQGEARFNPDKANTLYQAIFPFLTEENFLLVSVDFSHHGDVELTEYRNNLTRRFFSDPSKWFFACCDNRPGIWIYSTLFEHFPDLQMKLLHVTDSFEISGMDSHDITSYFFSFGVLGKAFSMKKIDGAE
ncbi:MAG: AmmeMemoRadiSam system protein B [Spirochaetales bacterium]|nr:AmmeMemoRadiSam system protein B [Spirochaetales bacterium]